MLMLSLAISCLTTSNLPLFVDLTFQGPMHYCSLQNLTLLPSSVTSTAGCCFCFDSISSLFLELFLHWCPVAYWAPINLGSSSLCVLSFCHFMMFMGFSRQESWNGLPFPSTVDHVFSELSTMIHPSWMALQGMAHSFIELDKAVVHVISLLSFLFSCCWFFICLFVCFCLFYLEVNYFTILYWFLPYFDMNQPCIYMCSTSWTPFPPPSPSQPSGSSQCTSPEHPVSWI